MFDVVGEETTMRELTAEELEQVSGGVLNLGIGAAIGAGTYLVYQGMTGGRITAGGLIGATVAGAVTSGFSAMGVGLVGSAAIGTGVGAAADNASYYYAR